MDTLSAGLTTSRDTNALYGALSIPWGYGTLSALASWSEYQNLIGDVALVYGATRSYTLSYGRLIDRDREGKNVLDLALTRRVSNRFIDDVALTPQTETVVRAGINRLERFQVGREAGQWSVDAGIAHGLPWLGGGRDRGDLPREAARYQFTKLELTGSPICFWMVRGGGEAGIW